MRDRSSWLVWKPGEGEHFNFGVPGGVFDNWAHACTVIESKPRRALGGLVQWNTVHVADVMKRALSLILREKTKRPCLGAVLPKSTGGLTVGWVTLGYSRHDDYVAHADDGEAEWPSVVHTIAGPWTEKGGLIVASRTVPMNTEMLMAALDPADGLGRCLASFGDWESILHVDELGALVFSRLSDVTTVLEEE